MSDQQPKVVAIENLKIDLRFGLEDKKDQLYNVSFSFKDGAPYKWSINVNYAAFQELNKTLSLAGSHVLSTEFPKAHRSRAAFRMKLPQDILDQRRNELSLWLRELVATYDLLPETVRDAVISFLKVPAEYNLKFISKDMMSDGSRTPTGDSARLREAPAKTRRPSGTPIVTAAASAATRRPSSSKVHRYSYTQATNQPLAEEFEGGPLEPVARPFNKKVYTVYSLFLNVLELVEILLSSVSTLHTSTTVNHVLCLSRSERVIDESIKPIGRLFLEDLFSVYFFGCYCALLCCVITTATYDDYFDGALAGRLLNVSIIAICVMLFHDQYSLHIKNIEIQRYNAVGFDPLQSSVNKFLRVSDDTVYTEYLAPYNGQKRPSSSEGSKVKVILRPVRGSGLLLRSYLEAEGFNRHRSDSLAERDSFSDAVAVCAPAGYEKLPSIEVDSNAANNSGAASHSESSPASDFHTPTTGEDHSKSQLEQEKQRKFAARKAFDDFVFPGITPTAAAMFIDRRYTHNFQVRGANYLTDKKKIHPGSAMCKLMLLELYEVDSSKDGDRHDHIASRGLCRSRRETIAALPGNPFQIIVNFQIPGDPPVSVVAYFAVPPDLAERYEKSEVAVFQSLFSQFINLPANECERLAAWGVVDSGAATATMSGDDTEDSEGEGGDEPKAASSVTTPAPAAEKGGSWFKMPSDIRWPDPHEPGALPQSDFRNLRFKLIPSVTEGPWVVKTAVRSQPALLGRKVVQRYFRGEGYMEIDIHVGSSVIAMNVVGVCRGYTKMAAADLGIVIQGEDPSELPEKMLGCVCFNHIDMEVRHKLD